MQRGVVLESRDLAGAIFPRKRRRPARNIGATRSFEQRLLHLLRARFHHQDRSRINVGDEADEVQQHFGLQKLCRREATPPARHGWAGLSTSIGSRW